jgi:hypothetical protein
MNSVIEELEKQLDGLNLELREDRRLAAKYRADADELDRIAAQRSDEIQQYEIAIARLKGAL